MYVWQFLWNAGFRQTGGRTDRQNRRRAVAYAALA